MYNFQYFNFLGLKDDNNIFDSSKIRGPGGITGKLNKGRLTTALFYCIKQLQGLKRPFLLSTI